jgi:predicted phosphoribosyltransferase
MFRDRQEAGRLLAGLVAKQLASVSSSHGAPAATVVVGLPRGGLPVAKEVALALNAPLTILVSKKIGAPCQPELAIGAVTSRGAMVLEESLRGQGKLVEYAEQQARQLAQITRVKEQDWLKQAHEQPVNFGGKFVIVVDDGVATGMTTLAALRSIADDRPARLILAVPVVASQTVLKLQGACDLVIALLAPSDLQAVGLYYEDFHQVEDDEMLDAIVVANKKRRTNRAS